MKLRLVKVIFRFLIAMFLFISCTTTAKFVEPPFTVSEGHKQLLVEWGRATPEGDIGKSANLEIAKIDVTNKSDGIISIINMNLWIDDFIIGGFGIRAIEFRENGALLALHMCNDKEKVGVTANKIFRKPVRLKPGQKKTFVVVYKSSNYLYNGFISVIMGFGHIVWIDGQGNLMTGGIGLPLKENSMRF